MTSTENQLGQASPQAPDPARAGPFRNPIMRAILGSETISSLGSQMTYLVLPWFVLITTGSVTRMGLVFAIELVPVALLGIPSGLLVQRIGVRKTMLIGDSARALLIALIPVLHSLHDLSFGVLMLVVFCVGAFSGPYVAAQRLVIPETFGDDETIMVQGNALLESATRVTTLVGPAAAGVLIGVLGSVNVLWIDVASFLISFCLLAARLPQPNATPAGEQGSPDMLAGVRFVLGNPLLRRVTTSSLIFGLFFPMLLASIPVVADRSYGVDPRVAGLLFAAWGAGAMIGLFGVMRYAAKLPPLQMGALAAVALALPLWLLALPLNAWEFGLVLLVSGVFTPMLNAPLITLLMLRTPPHLRVQAITFVMTANLVAGPAGYALAGPAFQYWGMRATFLLVAGGISVAALLMTTIVRVDLGGDEQEQGQEIEALLEREEALGQEPGAGLLAAELESLLDGEVVAHGQPSAEADPAASPQQTAENGTPHPEADAG
jgi:MFS family permease